MAMSCEGVGRRFVIKENGSSGKKRSGRFNGYQKNVIDQTSCFSKTIVMNMTPPSYPGLT